MKKILFGSAALLIAAGAYFNLRMSETRQEKLQVSELTLKNLEAMGCDGSGVECDIFPDCQQGLMEPTEGACAARATCANGIQIGCSGKTQCLTWTDREGVKHVQCDEQNSAMCY